MSTEPSAEMALLEAALDFDPLAEAERLTGESYKDDDSTLHLGIALSMEHGVMKARLLQQRADSYYSMEFEPSLNLFYDLGFAEVLRDQFDGRGGLDTFVILWHPDGLLALCESYGEHRNTAKVYYNYRHESGGYPSGLTSSGRMCGQVWVGDHDAREGIRHNLTRMRAEGRFLNPWVERPFLWLLTYADTDGEYDCDAINEQRIRQLPEHIRAAVTPVSTAAGERALS